MAFPTTVTTAGHNMGCIGPFVSSTGNVYVGMVATIAFDISMFKATDPSSAFAGVGTDVVTGSGTDQLWAIAGAQQGDLIHVVSKNGVSDGTSVDIRYHVFNMATDTWTTTNTLVKSNMTLAGGAGVFAAVDIVVRGDGAVFIIYNGAAELVSAALYERAFYARNLSGSWTADFALGTSGVTQNWAAGRAVLGGANRVSFFFQNISTFNVFERTLNTSNVLESLSAAASSPLGAFEAHEQRGCYLTATDVVHFPFQRNTGELGSINFTASDTASVNVDLDITGATNALGSPYRHVSSFAPHGNTVVHAFINDTNDIYTQTKVGGAAWGTPSLRRTVSASAVYTTAFTRSSALVLGMVYLDSGDHFYDEMTLSTIGANSVLASKMGLLGVGI
jgi:hypothetical protein